MPDRIVGMQDVAVSRIGSSNSRCAAMGLPGVVVIAEAGIDTTRMLFRVWDERQQAVADEWCGQSGSPSVLGAESPLPLMRTQPDPSRRSL